MKYFAGRNLIILMGLGFSLTHQASVFRPLKTLWGENATISPNFKCPTLVGINRHIRERLGGGSVDG